MGTEVSREDRAVREERRRSALWKAASYAVLAAAVVFAVGPLWIIVVLALESSPPAADVSAWRLPVSPGFGNFAALFARTDFLRWVANSVVVSLAVTAIGVLLSSSAGYALSRFRFFGRLAVLNALLITQIFPATMLLLPIFLILLQLKLINTFIGLVLIYLATALPFCIWQMKNFYDSIPESIEEAAAMDGCTPGEIFRKVVIPVSAPGLTVAALFSFAVSWNEYVVAAILLQDAELFTLPLGLRLLQADSAAGLPSVFAAGALLVAAPMILLYLALSRFLTARVQDIRIRF